MPETGEDVPVERGMSRKRFLRLGGASLAGMAMLGTAGCGGGEQQGGPVGITFTFGPDASGSLQGLIDRFNKEHEGEIKVTWRTTAAASDDYFASVNYTTQESQSIFTNGDATFMRNWTFVYALLSSPETSKIKPEQVDISTIPVSEAGKESFSGLGGWNFLVNAASEDKLDEIWAFIEYMSSAESQKTFALQSARLPTLKSLYEDEEVLTKLPVAALGKEALQSARPRPISPYYSDMSLVMAEHFNEALKGSTSVGQALQDMQGGLQNILDQA